MPQIEAQRIARLPNYISKGHIFEKIEAAKFNVNAAAKGSSLRAHTTAELGLPHSKADLLIMSKGQVVQQAQLKVGSRAYETNSLSSPKYNGLQKVVPRDHAQRVRELALKRGILRPLRLMSSPIQHKM